MSVLKFASVDAGVSALVAKGLTNKTIAKKLNQAGLKNSRGGKITEAMVNNRKAALNLTKGSPSAATAPKTAFTDVAVIHAIVANKALSDSKVRSTLSTLLG